MFELNSKQHLDIFLTFIEQRSPFCLIRPSDGEYYVLIGKKFNNIDNWHFNGTGSLKDDLSNQLHIASKSPNTYIGIPCQDCNREIMYYYMETYNMNKSTTTFANIFCNSNWHKFTHTLKDNNTPIYYIGPKITSTNNKFNIVEHFEVDPFLVDKWDIEKNTITASVLSWISSRSGVFCFSVGPISKIWASKAFELYSSNIYLDVGSAFDYDLKGGSNRLYTVPNSHYSRLDCRFE
jgi:hypothetical protein